MNKREDEAIRKQERLIYKSQLEEKIRNLTGGDFHKMYFYLTEKSIEKVQQFLIEKLLEE